MIAVTELDGEALARVRANRAVALRQTRELFSHPDFENAVRQATNTPSRVRLRIDRMVEALTGIA